MGFVSRLFDLTFVDIRSLYNPVVKPQKVTNI